MEQLKTVDEKIAYAIEKVKALKDEKAGIEKQLADLEETLRDRDREIERLLSEKAAVKGQIENLLQELESIPLK